MAGWQPIPADGIPRQPSPWRRLVIGRWARVAYRTELEWQVEVMHAHEAQRMVADLPGYYTHWIDLYADAPPQPQPAAVLVTGRIRDTREAKRQEASR